jgi:hypothetical protein
MQARLYLNPANFQARKVSKFQRNYSVSAARCVYEMERHSFTRKYQADLTYIYTQTIEIFD